MRLPKWLPPIDASLLNHRLQLPNKLPARPTAPTVIQPLLCVKLQQNSLQLFLNRRIQKIEADSGTQNEQKQR